MDDSLGSYSGIPDKVLNQYGFSVNLKEDYHELYSEYPGTVYQNMVMRVKYKNNSDVATKIHVNLKINELK